MGVVYLAEDGILKRQVAIKLVRGGIAEHEHAMLRFRREAEVSAQLNHPNVIVVYDVGEEPGHGPFIAMEYVEGSDLDQMIRAGEIDVERGLQVLIQAMRALEAAHKASVVHRDVKPANLLVSRDGRVKLLDFGIARSEDSTLTTTGMFLGTPAFMAPELIHGADASEATDRYAFGVVALELITGRRPFRADSTPALLYKIINDPPDLSETLDPALREVFLKVLAKDPAQRFPDLRSFLDALIGAAPLDAGARSALRALLGASDTVDMRRSRETAATTIAEMPQLTPGASAASVGRWIAGTGVVAAAALALGIWLYPREEVLPPSPPLPVATRLPVRVEPTAAAAAAIPIRLPVATEAPRPVATAAPPVPTAEPVLPTPVVLVTPDAKPTAEPAREARLPDGVTEPPAATAAVERAPAPTVLARQKSKPKPPAARAQSLAPAVPRAAADKPKSAPVWGEIRPEGAQRVE
jgi:serine/threonine-protein kinase